MLALFAALATAAPYTIEDVDPRSTHRPVVLVVTPGFTATSFKALEAGLESAGRDVHRLTFAPDATPDEVRAGIIAASQQGGTLVAHGVGATFALQAHAELESERLVLLAPVLDVWPTAAMSHLAQAPVGRSLTLVAEPDSAGALLLGDARTMGTVSGDTAREVQGWVLAGGVPLDASAVQLPVWLAVSSGDDVASVEAVVPRAHELPDHHLERLGLNHWHSQDFSHLEMLTHPVPVRIAINAVKQKRWRKQRRHDKRS